MEIPVINRISEMDSTLISLPNPSFLSQSFSSPSTFQQFSRDSHHFLKWVALIFSLLFTFTGIIKRIKILIITFQRQPKHSISEPYFLQTPNEEEDVDFSGEDDRSSSSSSLSFEYEEENDDLLTFSEEADFDFHVRCSGYYSDEFQWHIRNFVDKVDVSLSDFSAGERIVKLWDNLQSGFDFDEFQENNITEQKILPVSVLSPDIVWSARKGLEGNMTVKLWDRRVGNQSPAMIAECKAWSGEIESVSSGGVGKVYLRNDLSSELVVRDVRNVGSPLENLTMADVDTLVSVFRINRWA